MTYGEMSDREKLIYLHNMFDESTMDILSGFKPNLIQRIFDEIDNNSRLLKQKFVLEQKAGKIGKPKFRNYL